MSELTAKFVMNVEGNLSAMLDKLSDKFEKLKKLTGNLGGGGVEALEAGLNKTEESAERLNETVGKIGRNMATVGNNAEKSVNHIGRIRSELHNFTNSVHQGIGDAFGAAAAGFGLIEPIRKAAELDNTLQHIAITAGLSGKAASDMKASMTRDLTDLAMQTGQSTEKLADTMGYFGREGIGLKEARGLTGTAAMISTAYNATPEAAAHTAFALRENMGVSQKDMGGALSSLALAGKQADMPMEQLAMLFPNIAPSAGMLGEHGRKGVDDLGAMLAIARKNAGTSGEAATKLVDFIGGVASPIVAKHLKAIGINVKSTVEGANKRGESPVLAVLEKLEQKHKTGAFDLGKIFHNKEQREFAQAMLRHLDEFEEIRKKVASADPKMLQNDYEEGSKSLTVELEKSSIAFEALEQRIGRGFAPVLHVITIGVNYLNYGLEKMDDVLPGLSSAVIGTVGSLIAMVAATSALGAISGPLVSGWRLVSAVFSAMNSPLLSVGRGIMGVAGGFTVAGVAVAAVLAIFAMAAIDIYKNWGRFRPFFVQMWNGVLTTFRGAKQAIVGLLTGDWGGALAGVKKMMDGQVQIFRAEWEIVKGVFNDFLKWIDGWVSGLGTKISNGVSGAFKSIGSKAGEFGKQAGDALGSAATSAKNFFMGGGSTPGTHGEIVVRAEAGTSITNVKSHSGAALKPSRGPMLGRP